MTAVSNILSLAQKISGMRTSAESDIALAAMNQAYLRACLDTELTGSDATYTVTAATGTIAASSIAGAQVYRAQHLNIQSQGNRVPLRQVSRQELLDYRSLEEWQTTPIMYSVSMVGGQPTVDFFPDLMVGDVIGMSYLAAPPTLTTATTAITYLPDMFHQDILTTVAVAALLERDGKFDGAQVWHARSLDGIARLEEYVGQMGGNANRAYISHETSVGTFPDTRMR